MSKIWHFFIAPLSNVVCQCIYFLGNVLSTCKDVCTKENVEHPASRFSCPNSRAGAPFTSVVAVAGVPDNHHGPMLLHVSVGGVNGASTTRFTANRENLKQAAKEDDCLGAIQVF